MSIGSIEERLAPHNLPVLGVGDVIWFIWWEKISPVGVLSIDQKVACRNVGVFSEILFVLTVHPTRGHPRTRPEAESCSSLRELTREQTAELGADKLGMHISWEKE